MKNLVLFCLLVASTLVLSSCADPRMDKRAPAYNPKQCPMCTQNPGVCNDCSGNGKCAYCKGTGKFTVSTKNYPEKEINVVSYTEECPFCKGTGVCAHCKGTGKCTACKGTAKVSGWNFDGKYNTDVEAFKKNAAQAQPQAAPAPAQ